MFWFSKSSTGEHPESEPAWWKEAIVYQIYPASFKDSNNDGWGDIQGIYSKLEYIKDLGADTIWICPFYDSPQQDMGYDISDYEKVWPRYGLNEDIFKLIDKAHNMGIKIVVDLVINHCSDTHDWFKESRSSLNNPKRDWFIWRPPKDFSTEGVPLPPNNWRSHFGGSAWTFDEKTGEFYLRLFAKGQPDFNWENKNTRYAIYESAIGYWLDHGVDGFRIDTAGLYSKVKGLPDAPIVNPDLDYQPSDPYSLNGPRIHEFHKEMHKFMSNRVKDGRELLTVGEVGKGKESVLKAYTSYKEKEISELFNFEHTNLGRKTGNIGTVSFRLSEFKRAIAASFLFINNTDCWATVYLENHDQPRSVTRFGNDTSEFRSISAKLLALLLISLTGTLYVYQGQELGMINFKDWPMEKYEDVEVKGTYTMLVEKFGESSEEVMDYIKGLELISRDHARTPFPWSSEEPYAGFTSKNSGGPWFSLTDTFKEGINVEDQLKDADSVLSFWKKAIKTRKCHKNLLNYGYDFAFHEYENENIFAFTKIYGEEVLFTVLNFSCDESKFSFPEIYSSYNVLFGNYLEQKLDPSSTLLKPWEGRLYLAKK